MSWIRPLILAIRRVRVRRVVPATTPAGLRLEDHDDADRHPAGSRIVTDAIRRLAQSHRDQRYGRRPPASGDAGFPTF